MVAPTILSLTADLEALTARVAALETQVTTNAARITDLAISDDASGWKKWRENKR